MQIDPNDPVSVEIVNKKLEAFVEVVLGKIIEQQVQIAELKQRIANLERGIDTAAYAT
jgi:hypothetical protein